MVNEHYVPQSYLRLLAPPNESLISRYSLVETHEGGDYRTAYNRYPTKKAASTEDFADGWLEQNEINQMENAAKQTFEKLQETTVLDKEGIATISQFVMFQGDRTPLARRHYQVRRLLGDHVDNTTNWDDLTLADGWEEILVRNAAEGHEQLQHMGWLLVKNDSDTPFITSDNPSAQYFARDLEAIENSNTQAEGREIYFPIGQDHLFVFLDPSRFELTGQYPNTKIDKITISDPADIHEVNQLQVLSASREIFGPVGYGDYLEEIVDELILEFPNETYIRGYTGDLGRLQLAYSLAAGFANSPWYRKYGKPIINAEQKEAHAIWEHDHDIGFVHELRRDEPITDYWDNITV
ncbi:DUF4238 domain-containing protein [Halovenus marina]|uniref:DUF4238 domain-containing protein n=1 Tax=Halovenus marina TaxID=3396621 RepID=UPI003F54FB89